MNGVLKCLTLLGITLIFNNQLQAQVVAVPDGVHCKVTELDLHPIKTGDFSFTISRFKNGSFKILIKNLSGTFIPFIPEDMTVLGSDGSQNYITGSFISFPLSWVPPTQIKIAPQAHINLTYQLSDEVKLPARIYYSGKPIAEISK